jgi:hypothetical protein
VPIGTNTLLKAQVAALESKKRRQEEVEKVFNDTHPCIDYHENMEAKVVEIKEAITKI